MSGLTDLMKSQLFVALALASLLSNALTLAPEVEPSQVNVALVGKVLAQARSLFFMPFSRTGLSALKVVTKCLAFIFAHCAYKTKSVS
jgi:hypothetical protein